LNQFKLKHPIVVLLISFLAVGCAEQISIDEIEANQAFVFRCELQPGHEPVATLQLTSLFDGSKAGGHLSDADIFLKDGTDANSRMIYNPKTRKYIGDLVNIDPRKKYTITVSHKDYPDLQAESSTSIPSQIRIDSLQAKFLRKENGVEFIKTSAFLPEVSNKEMYFHIIPKRRRAQWINGQWKCQEIEDVEIDKIYNDNFVVQQLYHRPGVMVDGSRLDDLVIEFDVRSNDTSDESITSAIFYEVISVTRDYYYFHIARSNQLRDARDLNGTPVINYTNMKNGFGLFTGKSVRMDSITVDR
jgi:hypothetical protein